MLLRSLHRGNVTWDECVAHAEVVMDSFRRDYLYGLIFPSKYMFVKDFEDLTAAERTNYFRMRAAFARKYYLELLSGSGLICILYDKDPKRAVATTFWKMPHFSPLYRRLSTYERICFWFRRKWLGAIDFLSFLWSDRGKNPLYDPKFAEIVGNRIELAGLDVTPKKLELLAHKSAEQLADTVYPVDYTYHSSMVAVRESEQRKGYARALFERLFSDGIPKHRTPFEYEGITSYGPVKLGLFSSPAGRLVYPRLGFREAANATATLKDGSAFTHDYYQRALPGT